MFTVSITVRARYSEHKKGQRATHIIEGVHNIEDTKNLYIKEQDKLLKEIII